MGAQCIWGVRVAYIVRTLPVVSALMGELDCLCACEALYPKLWRAKRSYIFTIKVISELSNVVTIARSQECIQEKSDSVRMFLV